MWDEERAKLEVNATGLKASMAEAKGQRDAEADKVDQLEMINDQLTNQVDRKLASLEDLVAFKASVLREIGQ